MWSVVSFRQGKLESSRRHKGMHGKYVLAWKGEALNALNRGTQMKHSRGWHRQMPHWTSHQQAFTVPLAFTVLLAANFYVQIPHPWAQSWQTLNKPSI